MRYPNNFAMYNQLRSTIYSLFYKFKTYNMTDYNRYYDFQVSLSLVCYYIWVIGCIAIYCLNLCRCLPYLSVPQNAVTRRAINVTRPIMFSNYYHNIPLHAFFYMWKYNKHLIYYTIKLILPLSNVCFTITCVGGKCMVFIFIFMY